MIKVTKIISLTMFGVVGIVSGEAYADITTSGVSPASNTYESFNESSLTRDAELNDSLGLLKDFYPSIGVTYAGHDNVRRRTKGNDEDNKLTVTPSLGYRTDIGRHKFYASYAGIFVRHDTYEQDDVESNLLNATLGLDVSQRFDLNLFAGFGETFEERGISGSPGFGQLSRVEDGEGGYAYVDDSALNEVDMEFYGADLIYGRKFSPLNAVVGFEKQTIKYDGNFSEDVPFVNDRSRVREKDSWHIDVSYRFSESASVFGRYQNTEIDYSLTADDLDSTQDDYMIGVRWKPTSALSGVVGVGHTDKDFHDTARLDYSGSTYYANLAYSITPFSVVTLNASKMVEEPGDQSSSFFESELLGASWNHALTEKVSFSLYGKLIDDEFESGRVDDFVDVGFNIDYSFRRWLELGLYYGEIERRSNYDNIDYDDRYFGIKLYSNLRSDD